MTIKRKTRNGRGWPVVLFLFLAVQSCRNNQPVTQEGDLAKPDSATVAKDPLPSWNDGPLKKSIIDYVSKVTRTGDPAFIPVADRIATFDNDGTLWAERPYMQELFAFYRVKEMIKANPALAKKQPFKAVVEGDKSYFAKGGEKAAVQLVALTHTGMTEEAFERSARAFIAEMKYPGRNVPVQQIVYRPQVELLEYLRANGFKTFIVTGGTIEFVRTVSQELYGIPPEQVVGTSFKYKYVDSNQSVMRLPELDHFNDKTGKPVGIQLHIGKRPVFACGNEGGQGDIAMLHYSQGNRYPSFQLLVNHNDSTREFYYQEKDSLSLKTAASHQWHVVSMKDDWKNIW